MLIQLIKGHTKVRPLAAGHDRLPAPPGDDGFDRV